MTNTHDPYLNTVKRTLAEQKNRVRKDRIKNMRKKEKEKGFLSKSVILSDYIYLPEGFKNLFVLTLFILVPYLFGTAVILSLLLLDVFKSSDAFNLNSFMLTWTVGYELIAFILLLLIIKSALFFRES
jgi:hypothetical protein